MIRRFLRAENLYYKGHWCHKKGLTKTSKLFMALNKILNGCDINCKAEIGKNLHIAHAVGLVIGGKIQLGNNCSIYHNSTLGSQNKKIPVIKDNVIIYPHSIIAGDILIPENSRIPAGSILITKRPQIWDQKLKKLVEK